MISKYLHGKLIEDIHINRLHNIINANISQETSYYIQNLQKIYWHSLNKI